MPIIYCCADEGETYDVFLSHRGVETKQNFVGHLHNYLQSAGLKAFLDIQDIDKGEECWECIERAIKKTPVALVIFSKRFSESEWCLKELQLMLETPGVKVLPVFYKVKPSDLRKLEGGPLAAGIKKLQQSGRFSSPVIEKWKELLSNASTIDGWEYKEDDQR